MPAPARSINLNLLAGASVMLFVRFNVPNKSYRFTIQFYVAEWMNLYKTKIDCLTTTNLFINLNNLIP